MIIPDAFGETNPISLLASVPKFLTLDQIVTIAPIVGEILREAACIRYSAWRDYERLKRQLGLFVGWHADHPLLRTDVAYLVAMRALLKAMRR